MHRALAALCGLVLVLASLVAADAPKPVKPPAPRDYAAPGGVGPSRGWYIWHKFDPQTWEVEVSRDPPAETWKARVLPYATTYRYLTYGARPDELHPGERVNVFFAPDEKSRWGYVVHFQDELSQMKGHNHAWQVRSVEPGGKAFKASLWMGNEKKLDDKEIAFDIDPACKQWSAGKQVPAFPLKPAAHIYMTWVVRKDRRVALLLTDDASVEAIKKEEQERVARQVAEEGVAGQVEAADGTTAKLLVYATYWAQMRDFKPGQRVTLRATGPGFRPAGEAITAKLVSFKVGGQYGSGPADVVLEIAKPGDVKTVKTWTDQRVVRLAAAPEERHSVRFSLTDATTGKPIAARVYLRDERGEYLKGAIRTAEDAGSVVRYERSRPEVPGAVEIHSTVSAHPFLAELKAGKHTVIVERGKEYLPLAQEVIVPVAAPVELKLQRWIDMAGRGWYSGDTHVHRKLEELPNVILAEDLNVALPLSYWVTDANESPLKNSKVKDPEPGRLIEVDNTHVIYPRNTEYELFTFKKKSHMLGAFFVLNHRTVLDEGVPPVKALAEKVHKEGALIELDKHNWPWTMMIVPVMGADLYELANNHVWRAEFAFGNWAEKPADYMKIERNERGWTEWGWLDYGFQNYYALLNCGLKLKATGGTASGVHPVPLGFGRVYVHLPEGFTYDGWMKGLAAGRSFVSTGPMLLTEVNGKPAGHVFQQTAAQDYTVKGLALSAQPLGRIEVIVNGEIVKTVKPENRKSVIGSFESTLNETVKIDGTSWIAVRCFEDRPDKRIRFAHGSPVFIDVAGKPIRPRKVEADYLIQRVQDQLQRNADVLPKEALDEYRQALEFYKGKGTR